MTGDCVSVGRQHRQKEKAKAEAIERRKIEEAQKAADAKAAAQEREKAAVQVGARG